MTLQHSTLHNLETSRSWQQRFGWELPAVYGDVASEYQAATTSAAVHDASYAGRLKGTGPDLLDLLNRMSTNLVRDLEPGQGVPTILTTDRGRILDLLGVVNLGDYVLLITSPGLQQTVIDWLDKYTIMEELTIKDITASTTMLAVFGPLSESALEQVAGVSLADLPPFHSVTAEIGGQPAHIIRRHLGRLTSFDLALDTRAAASAVWQKLVDAGVTPVGMEAFEVVRVEQGVPFHGQEMGEPYNPLEAGLIGSIDFHKGCYIGQEVIARLDSYKKVQKHLVMLRFAPRSVVELGAALQHEGREVGVVTSVSRLPTTSEIIGLGYVRKGSDAVGASLELAAPSSGSAQVADIPLLFGPGGD